MPKTDVQKWLDRIETGVQAQTRADDDFGYTTAERQYRGDYLGTMPTFIKDAALVPINEVYAYAKTFIPSVYSRNPKIFFNPQGADIAAQTKLLELAVNAYWRELNLKRQVKRCILDAILAEGVMKLGYTASLGSIEKKADDKPGLYADEYIESEEIFAKRVSWRNVIRDPDSVDGFSDARWVTHRIILPLEAVRNSSLYENTRKLEATHVRDVVTGKRKEHNVRQELVEIYEVWDFDNGRVLALSTGNNEELWKPKDWPYDFQGYPFVLLRFNDNPDSTYAPNLISPWVPQLWEKIKLRAMALDHIKRFNRQLWAKKGSVSPKEIEKFTRGVVAAINFYEGDSPPMPSSYPPIQTDIYAVENKIDLDKDNVSGMPNAVRSAPQRTQSRTLGEIDRLISAFSSRQSEPQDVVEEACAEVATKLAGLIKQYLPGTKFVRATQREYQEIMVAFKDRWVGNGFRFTREDIKKAEFEASVKVGSTLPLDRQGRMESLISLLKLGPTVGVGPGSELSLVIGKQLFGEFENPEIEQAYEKFIAKVRAMQTVARQQQITQADMMQDKIEALRQRGQAEFEDLGIGAGRGTAQ